LKLEDRGTFRSGTRADVTIIDPENAWTFDVASSKSKSRNTPFHGARDDGRRRGDNRGRSDCFPASRLQPFDCVARECGPSLQMNRCLQNREQ
jgi:hypothetical protein